MMWIDENGDGVCPFCDVVPIYDYVVLSVTAHEDSAGNPYDIEVRLCEHCGTQAPVSVVS